MVPIGAPNRSAVSSGHARLQGPGTRIVLVHAWQMPVVAGYDMVLAVDPGELSRSASEALDQLVAEIDDPADRAGGPSGTCRACARRRSRGRRGGDDRARSQRQQSRGDDARLDRQLRVAPHDPAGRRGPRLGDGGAGRDRSARFVVVGVDDLDLEGEPLPAHENPSVRAVRWAYGLPGIERVRVVHAWFLPSLAIGVHAEIAAETEEMDAAAQAEIDHVLAAAGPPPPKASSSSASRYAVRQVSP